MSSPRPGPVGARSRHALVLLFAAISSWWVASPGWAHLSDRIVGDNGDAMWQLSVMRWTLDALGSMRLPWTPPMFFPTPGTYAYSDPMLTQAALAAPLRALGASPALLANILVLGSWTAGVYFAWRLLRRICGNDAIALAGAAAWAFCEVRVATVSLFQIVTAAALVPLVFERLLVLLDRPTIVRGVGLGAAIAATVLGALYYGPLLALTVPVAAVAWLLAARRRPTRELVVAALAGAVVVAVAVLPIAARYQDIHDRDHLRRAPEAQFSATVTDLTTVAPHHARLAALPGLGRAGNGERALFPGLFVVLAVPAAGIVALRRLRRRDRSRFRIDPALAAIGAAGVSAYLLASGTELHVFGLRLPAPLGALDGVPGFSGVRAPVRFAVAGQLALVAVACCVFERLLREVHTRGAVALSVTVLVAVSMVDAGSWLPTADVPHEARWAAVDRALQRRPAGAVVELPIFQTSDGAAQPRVEAPRLYLAAIDGNPRVNGYSGYQPPGFDTLVRTINTFPAPAAVAELARQRVRYIVLRRDVVGYLPRGATRMTAYGTDDDDRLLISATHLASIRATLPSSVREIGTFGSAVLLELVSPSGVASRAAARGA